MFEAMLSSIRTAQVVSSYHTFAGLFGLGSAFSLFSSFLCGYKASRPLAKQKWIKKKLVSSITISCLLGAFFIVGFPGYHAYTLRVMNSHAQTDLNNLYEACNKYWKAKGKNKMCDKATVANQKYGFVQTDHISIKSQGTSKNFIATAEHSHTNIRYTIDASGNITKEFTPFN